jgi:hypothetical protein
MTQLPPRLPASDYPATIELYRSATAHVAAGAGQPDPVRDVLVTEQMPERGARAIADSRTGVIYISKGEADLLEPLAARAARDGWAALEPSAQADLLQREFTALHEGSHLTGPAMPPASSYSKVDTMWEEALASLNARGEQAAFTQARHGAEFVRPPIAEITYGGMAQRATEVLALGGLAVDTPAFDEQVRTLAEAVPWRERPRFIAEWLVSSRLGRAVPEGANLFELEQYVHSYITRFEAGGRIASVLDDAVRLAARA